MKTKLSYYLRPLLTIILILTPGRLSCINPDLGLTKEEKIHGYLERGDLYFQTGDYQSYARAEKQYLNVVHLDPTNYKAYTQLGYIYYIFYENHLWRNEIEEAYEDWKKAYNCFKTALEYKPDCASAHLGWAMTHYCAQRYNKAIEHLEQALTLPAVSDFLKAKAYYWLGRCYIAQYKFTEMVRVYKKYLKIFPEGPQAKDIRRAIREVEQSKDNPPPAESNETSPQPPKD